MKNKKMIVAMVIIIILIAITVGFSLVFGCDGKQNAESNRHLTKIFDNVLDAGTYKNLDYNYADKWYQNNNDNWGGGCTAIGKTLDDGNTIVGRNMDLTYSHKSAYVFKTAVKGKNKTINLAYTHRDYAPEYEDALKNGISSEFDKMLPFYSDDVLNEKGLYVELNMRNSETWYDGSDKFSSSGTNEEGTGRVHLFELPMYIGLNCNSVDEIVPYLETLNIYSKKGYWNYSFLVADSTGKMGVIEIANNKIYFNEDKHAQANFYVTEELAKINEYKAGVGRYEYVTKNIDKVKNSDDMFKLMNDVRYSQMYNHKESKFDVRSELVETYPTWTYDYVMDDANKVEINAYLDKVSEMFNSLTLEEIKDKNVAWHSVFTEVVNCNKKTILVRFYEDDSRIMTLEFD